MAQLIKPLEISAKTVDGEVLLNIKLDININLSQNSTVQSSAPITKVEGKLQEKQNEDQTLWEIPDFASVPKIKFGSKEI